MPLAIAVGSRPCRKRRQNRVRKPQSKRRQNIRRRNRKRQRPSPPKLAERFRRNNANAAAHFLAITHEYEGGDGMDVVVACLLLMRIDVERANAKTFAAKLLDHRLHAAASAAPVGFEK